MNFSIEKCLVSIREELEKLEKIRFTGNIDFRVNWTSGNIANMNIGTRKNISLGWNERG